MADSQEIKNIVEGVVARVFDKRMSEMRTELHRGVGESLGSRVSELQLDVETGISDMFNTRVQEINSQVSKDVSEVLSGKVSDLHKQIEHGVTEVILASATEIRTQLEQGVSEVLDARTAALQKAIDNGISATLQTFRKEVEQMIEESSKQGIVDLRKDVERVVGEKSDHRIAELRKDVQRVVREVADKRLGELRHEVERAVEKTTEKRVNDLRRDVERVVGEVAENRVSSIRKDVEKVVAEAGEHRVEELRKDLVQKITQELEPALKSSKVPKPPASSLLQTAIAGIESSKSQTDALRALLDGAAPFSSRVALFVLKSDVAAGWQARGFEDNNAIKKLSLDSGSGLAARALSEAAAVSAAAGDFDAKFIAQFGAPRFGEVYLVPLTVRDKVPALVYADAGPRTDGECDAAALQLLVRAAGHWLELLALRKATGSATVEMQAEVVAEQEAPPVRMAAAAHAPSPPAPPPKEVEREPAAKPGRGKAPPAQDDEVHKKAKRFAKLLVDEIKLYNQAKVNEGRRHKDLYDRLKEDIEKSRASYDKRYANTSAGEANYFVQEVIKVLAEDDVAVLGSGFPQ